MFVYIQINCCSYFSWVAQDFRTVPGGHAVAFQPHVTGITMFENAAEISSLKAFETPVSGNIS